MKVSLVSVLQNRINRKRMPQVTLPARSQQGWIQQIWSVSGTDHKYVTGLVESVQLCQELGNYPTITWNAGLVVGWVLPCAHPMYGTIRGQGCKCGADGRNTSRFMILNFSFTIRVFLFHLQCTSTVNKLSNYFHSPLTLSNSTNYCLLANRPVHDSSRVSAAPPVGSQRIQLVKEYHARRGTASTVEYWNTRCWMFQYYLCGADVY